MNVLIIEDDQLLRRALAHSIIEINYGCFISKPLGFRRIGGMVNTIAASGQRPRNL